MVARRELPTAEVSARYEAGASLKALAAHYGVAVGTVRDRLREAGVARRAPGAPRCAIDDVRLVAAYIQHGSTRQAAAELGISRSTVQRRLRTHAGKSMSGHQAARDE